MMKRGINWKIVMVILCVAGIFAFSFAFLFGSSGLGFSDLIDVMAGNARGSVTTVFFKIRLPRAILCFFSGAALAVSGAVLQGLFRNPMADSYVIGVSSGAALGAACAMAFALEATFLGFGAVELFAFAGALAAVFIVYRLARVRGRVSIFTLLLSGIAISTLSSALVYCLMILFHEKMENIVMWTLGSFSSSSFEKVAFAVPLLIAGCAVCMFFGRDLNILLQGDESARHLGVEASKLRRVLLVVTTLLVSVVVSISGIIGFVGLIVPHMVRLTIGPDHKKLLPLSFLGGGVFLLLADTVARTVSENQEIPIGVVTAIIGVPFFLFLMRSSKGGRL